MKMKAGDRPNESEVIAAAIATFPAIFGLRAFPGKKFRISPSASYMSDYPSPNTLQLYTEIQNGDRWLSFSKGTPEELQTAMVQS